MSYLFKKSILKYKENFTSLVSMALAINFFVFIAYQFLDSILFLLFIYLFVFPIIMGYKFTIFDMVVKNSKPQKNFLRLMFNPKVYFHSIKTYFNSIFKALVVSFLFFTLFLSLNDLIIYLFYNDLSSIGLYEDIINFISGNEEIKDFILFGQLISLVLSLVIFNFLKRKKVFLPIASFEDKSDLRVRYLNEKVLEEIKIKEWKEYTKGRKYLNNLFIMILLMVIILFSLLNYFEFIILENIILFSTALFLVLFSFLYPLTQILNSFYYKKYSIKAKIKINKEISKIKKEYLKRINKNKALKDEEKNE